MVANSGDAPCSSPSDDTPLELAIRNRTDRFSLAIDAIDRIQGLGNRGAAAREDILNKQIFAKNYAFHEGIDLSELSAWKWPFGAKQ